MSQVCKLKQLGVKNQTLTLSSETFPYKIVKIVYYGPI